MVHAWTFKPWRHTLSTFILAACCVAQGTAATTGILSGYVRDLNGNPSPHARVRAISPSTLAETYTDDRGFFAFISLPPDVYSVAAEKRSDVAFGAGIRVDSDNTTFVAIRWGFKCGGTVRTFFGANPFALLDTKTLEAYPAVSTLPVPILWQHDTLVDGRCL